MCYWVSIFSVKAVETVYTHKATLTAQYKGTLPEKQVVSVTVRGY